MGADSWNNIFIGAAAFAAVFGVVAVVAQYLVIQLQKADAKAALDQFARYKLDQERKIEDAKVSLEQAKLRIEEEKTARLKMAEELGVRTLTEEQGRIFIDAVKGKVSEITVVRIMDAEAFRFGLDFLFAFPFAGANPKDFILPVPTDGYPYMTGVLFIYDPKVPAQKTAMEAVVKAFSEAKLGPIMPSIDVPTRADGTPALPPKLPRPALYIGLKNPPFAKYGPWWAPLLPGAATK